MSNKEYADTIIISFVNEAGEPLFEKDGAPVELRMSAENFDLLTQAASVMYPEEGLSNEEKVARFVNNALREAIEREQAIDNKTCTQNESE